MGTASLSSGSKLPRHKRPLNPPKNRHSLLTTGPGGFLWPLEIRRNPAVLSQGSGDEPVV